MVVKLQIPESAEIHVSKGQKVTVHDPFYSQTSQEDIVVPFARKLGIKSQDIFKHAKVVVGDPVKAGDILGEKKRVIGTNKLTADTSGTIKRIDHTTGEIVISALSDKSRATPAFFTAEVTDISEEEHTVSVELGKTIEYDASGEVDCGGMLNYIPDKDFFLCGEEDVKDRIILLDTVQSHIETKIEALGAEGVIFVEGTPPASIPSIQLKNASDFEKLKGADDKTVLFSHLDGKLYVY
jgi:predicted RNA-binding protein